METTPSVIRLVLSCQKKIFRHEFDQLAFIYNDTAEQNADLQLYVVKRVNYSS